MTGVSRGSVALVAALALAAVAGSLLAPTSAADPAGSPPDLGLSSVAAAAPAPGGGWWVLERSLRGGGGAVYRYTDDWTATGEVHRLRLQPHPDGTTWFSPTDLAAAEGGGWWVLGEDGGVYRFDDAFVHNGAGVALPRPGSTYNASSGYGLERSRAGGWWLAADRDLWRVTDEWTVPSGTVANVQSARGGFPVAVAEDADGLWVLEGYLGTGVSLYATTGDGARFDPSTLMTPRSYTSSRRPNAAPVASYGLQIVDTPVDVTRSGGDWWLVDADGQVHRFDRYWRYTGVTIGVGSGEARAGYPSDVVSPGVVLVPVVLGAGYLAPAVVTLMGLWWRRDPVEWRVDAAAGLGALAFLYGVVLGPHLVRPAVFAHPLLPLVVTLLAVVGPGVHLVHEATRGRTERVKPLVIAYAPVVVAVLAMLRPAIRPLLAPFG